MLSSMQAVKEQVARTVATKIIYLFFIVVHILEAIVHVQEEIERVLSKILNSKIEVTGASRTDRGVHAYSQFVTFETDKIKDKDKFIYSLNKLLNESVYAKSIRTIDNEFSPRYDVIMKTIRKDWDSVR